VDHLVRVRVRVRVGVRVRLSHMWITCSIMSSRRDSIAIPSTAWYARFCRDELTW